MSGPTRIGLVACVKGKLDHPAPARDLYASPLFTGRRRHVEGSCATWFVLSALHGLVDPEQTLEPYDKTLRTASNAERRAWSERVMVQLRERLGDLEGRVFEIHAGASYRDHGLVTALEAAGARVENPTEGLGIGRQLAFYARSS